MKYTKEQIKKAVKHWAIDAYQKDWKTDFDFDTKEEYAESCAERLLSYLPIKPKYKEYVAGIKGKKRVRIQ